MLDRSKPVVQKKNKNWLVLLTQIYTVVGLAIAGIAYAIEPTRFIFSVDTSFTVLSILYLGLTIWSFVSWYLVTNRLFDPYVLFLLAANVFNGGQIILEIFGLNEDGFLHNAFSVADALQIVYVVTLAIATMHLGALMAVVLNRQKTAAEKFREFLGRTSELTSGSRWVEDREPSSALALYAAPPAPENFFKSSIVPLSTILTIGRVFLFR
jgi:hypothetical protein